MQVSNPLVSVIIPFYNSQSYINRCVESIIKQTYKNLEIILIDDGSTDLSYFLCKKLAVSDKRIRLIHQDNNGVSAARNTGLKEARGLYIVFADADDWLNPTSIQEMIEVASKQYCDYIIFEYRKCNSLSDSRFDTCYTGSVQAISARQAFYKVINPFGFYGSVWGKLFKTEIINRYNLTFDEKINVGEDLLFVINYMTKISKYYYSNSVVYNYFNNKDSVLHSDKSVNFKKRSSILHVYEILLKMPELSSYRSRITAIYTRELCDWYTIASILNYKSDKLSLKCKIKKLLYIFLLDDTFTLKTKLNTCLKYLFPKFVYKIRKYNG